MALTPQQSMYNRGARESIRPRSCDTDSCPCTLTYWDRKLGSDPLYNVFLDGWSDAATGENQYRELYF